MSYVDKAEITREFYRKQGEKRERERILEIIAEVAAVHKQTPQELLEVLIESGRIKADRPQ
jgi:hypothetical protein